jgi:hypothetical protein
MIEALFFVRGIPALYWVTDHPVKCGKVRFGMATMANHTVPSADIDGIDTIE